MYNPDSRPTRAGGVIQFTLDAVVLITEGVRYAP